LLSNFFPEIFKYQNNVIPKKLTLFSDIVMLMKFGKTLGLENWHLRRF